MIFFECYIDAGLVHVKLCKLLGITPAGFFDLQVEEAFEKFQQHLVQGVRELYSRVTDELTKSGRRRPQDSEENEDVRDTVQPFDYQGYVIMQLEWYEKRMKPSFEAAQRHFGESQGREYRLCRPEDMLRDKRDEPTALICFDEAIELFSTIREPKMRYLSLKKSMRYLTKTDRSKNQKRFFGLLIDISSRISEPPPTRPP